jgi:pimeloyl-ACP methyl ester carboxylesterase
MDQKPTILFIHGAWHTNEAFGQVQNYLAEAGYGIKNVQLPSSSVEGPYVLGIDDDVEVIRNALEEIVHAKGDVVIVMHSYGGIPGSSAVRGFSKTDRQKQGKDGGVTQMIYMTALALDEGVSLKSGIGGSLAPWVTVHVRSSLSQFSLPPNRHSGRGHLHDFPC